MPAGLGRPVAGVRFLEQAGGLCALLPRLLVAAGSTTAHFGAADVRRTIIVLQRAVGKHGANVFFADLDCKRILRWFLLWGQKRSDNHSHNSPPLCLHHRSSVPLGQGAQKR